MLLLCERSAVSVGIALQVRDAGEVYMGNGASGDQDGAGLVNGNNIEMQ
jgi:hypothetical protein